LASHVLNIQLLISNFRQVLVVHFISSYAQSLFYDKQMLVDIAICLELCIHWKVIVQEANVFIKDFN